jgi:hypothetical protein
MLQSEYRGFIQQYPAAENTRITFSNAHMLRVSIVVRFAARDIHCLMYLFFLQVDDTDSRRTTILHHRYARAISFCRIFGSAQCRIIRVCGGLLS